MKNYFWAKTILTTYRYLERICNAIDNLVETNAIGSFYVSGTTYLKNGVEAVANKIIELSQRKITLINLKILTDNALNNMEQDSSRLLIEKYFDGFSAKYLAEERGLPMRTYFRHLERAEIKFLDEFERLGYKERDIQDMLQDEKWIMEIYRRLIHEKGNNEPSKMDIELC